MTVPDPTTIPPKKKRNWWGIVITGIIIIRLITAFTKAAEAENAKNFNSSNTTANDTSETVYLRTEVYQSDIYFDTVYWKVAGTDASDVADLLVSEGTFTQEARVYKTFRTVEQPSGSPACWDTVSNSTVYVYSEYMDEASCKDLFD